MASYGMSTFPTTSPFYAVARSISSAGEILEQVVRVDGFSGPPKRQVYYCSCHFGELTVSVDNMRTLTGQEAALPEGPDEFEAVLRRRLKQIKQISKMPGRLT